MLVLRDLWILSIFGLPALALASRSPPAAAVALSNVTEEVATQSAQPSVELNATEQHDVVAHVAAVAHHARRSPGQKEHDAIVKALTAAGNEYQRKISEDAERHNEAENKAQEAVSAKIHEQAVAEQLEAQQQIQKVLKKTQERALMRARKSHAEIKNVTVQPIGLPAFDRKVQSIMQEEKDKEKELGVQSKLVSEKKTDAEQAKKVTEALKAKAEKLRQEAEISKKIAQEKEDAAASAAKEESVAEKKNGQSH